MQVIGVTSLSGHLRTFNCIQSQVLPLSTRAPAWPSRQAHRMQHKRARTCQSTASDAAPSPPARAPSPPKQQMLIYVPPHPLIQHWLAIARNESTPPPIFRAAIAELGRLLIYEAGRDWLPTMQQQVYSPVGPADATFVDPTQPIKVVPILRAGLVLIENIATVLPAQVTYHVGLVRNEETLQATSYLNKLPKQFSPEDRILVADPMLATGGTVVSVVEDIISRGGDPSNMIVVCVVACPPALKQLSEKFVGLKVYTATIDAELNDKGYIVPGLGDAGDRAYGTL